MNKLQRHNQRVVAKALGKPLIITSIDVSSSRVIDVQTATWEEYWDGCDYVAEQIRRLREAWSTLIECSYSVRQRPPFVQAYFALLRTCLEGHARGNFDLAILEKVVGFETFSISCRDGRLAAGIVNIRNPAYLLSRVALPKAPENPKFLPLICQPGSLPDTAQLFCHYRRIGLMGGHRAQLFVYPPVDARNRSASYRLIAELFASLTPKNDPWVQERIRLLFDSVFADLVAPLRGARIQLLDLACGTARTTMGLCRRAFAKYRTSFDLTLVDVVRGARCIATTFYRHPRAFGNVVFRHESLYDWIDGVSGDLPGRCDLVLMLRICDVFSRFQIEELTCREARALIRRERSQSSVDADTTNPARLIGENRLENLHDRLWRSPFRNGMIFHQFSLSDYFRAVKTILDGGAFGVEGMIYAPIRRFDDNALVLPSGRSLIGQLMAMADRILIEDVDLTASRLQRHINCFGLSDLSVTDFTDRHRGHSASVAVIGWRQPLKKDIATAEMTAANERGAWEQQGEEGERFVMDEIEKGLSLAQRVHPKYRPAFDKPGEGGRAAMALYFLPHASGKDVLEVTRPRVIKWYCPFADQREFPSGHRYCINVYTGCQHKCQYCYATGYIAAEPNCKNRFRQDLCKDLEALEAHDVPPAPVHLSNSTDPLQPLEEQHRHTLFVLERLAEHRNRFTTITLLTKNPAMLMDDRYVQVLHRLNRLPPDHPCRALFDAKGYPPLRVECSLAFFNDDHRRLLDPAAPSVESRMEAMRFLRKMGFAVFPRIDPLFPHDPLDGGKRMADFGLPDVQSMHDLEGLVSFGRELAAGHLIYSAAKITRPKQGTLPPIMERMKRVYQHLSAGQPLVFHGGSWRLPEGVAAAVVLKPFLELCGRYSIPAKPCKTNLVTTP